MIQMTNNSEILRDCVGDRKKVISMGQNSWLRRCGIDLLIKMFLLLFNSIGLKSSQNAIFVDEVQNANMQNNLQQTADLTLNGRATFFRFHKIERKNHCRTGVLWTISQLILLFLKAIPYCASFLARGGELNTPLMGLLIVEMSAYLDRLSEKQAYVLMTDHHFYSTVVAERCPYSIVLQHGLIQDIRFFSPVRASAICCWSNKSARLINSSKAIVTGTLKFKMKDGPNSELVPREASKVLICLSFSQTSEAVILRLKPILEMKSIYGYKLLIKLHPGSLSPEVSSIKSDLGDGVEIYKEETIESLDFDFAIIEESTAVLDVACMGIPFILCPNSNCSYFSEYEGILPMARTDDELIDELNNFTYQYWKNGADYLLEREINHCESNLREVIVELLSALDGTR